MQNRTKAPSNSSKRCDVKVKLNDELRRLKELLGLDLELKVVWKPCSGSGLSGEVKEGVIYIYEPDEQKAVEVLRHEVVDYLLTSKLVKPLVDLINLLIKCRESEIYREKESLVNKFCKLLEGMKN